jgi:hypothetical protein
MTGKEPKREAKKRKKEGRIMEKRDLGRLVVVRSEHSFRWAAFALARPNNLQTQD